MADAARVAGKSQLISILSQRVRVGTPDRYHNKKTFNFENLENLKIVDERYEILEKDQEINL